MHVPRGELAPSHSGIGAGPRARRGRLQCLLEVVIRLDSSNGSNHGTNVGKVLESSSQAGAPQSPARATVVVQLEVSQGCIVGEKE